MKNLLTIKETSEILGVSYETLRNWDKSGKLTPVKTAGGHRRYKQEDIEIMSQQIPDDQDKNKELVATYSRVSSHEQKQKGDLDRQHNRLVEYCAKKGYILKDSFKEVASGMSDNRPRLNKLLKMIENKEINKVVVENKDRLTRFQFGIFEKYFSSHGVQIEWIEKKYEGNYQDELVNDIMSLMASFSGKLYGQRSAERRRKQKEEKVKNAKS